MRLYTIIGRAPLPRSRPGIGGEAPMQHKPNAAAAHG